MANFRFKFDETTLDQEVIKALKADFVTEPIQKEEVKHVHTRNSRTFITELRHENWQQNFDRRQRNLKDGFFCRDTEIFRSLGDVITDPRELTYRIVKPAWVDDMRPRSFVASPDKAKKKTGSGKRRNKELVKTNSGRELSFLSLRNETRQHEGGLADVRQLLKKTEKRITAIKAGHPCDKCLAAESEDADNNDVNVSTGPVMKKLSGLIDQEGTRSALANESLSLTTYGGFLDSEDKKLANLKTKLKYISIILISIHNMKVKDLRTRRPLSIDDVMGFRISKSYGREMMGFGGQFHRRRTIGSTVGTNTGYKKSKSRISPRTPRFLRRLEREPSSISTVETWDDLLAVGTNSNKQTPKRQNFTGLEVRKMREKKLQLWQTVHQQIKAIAASKVPEKSVTPVEPTEKLRNFINENKKEILLIKQDLRKVTSEKVKKIETEKLLTFYRKFAAFDELPLCYSDQREKMDNISSQYYSDLFMDNNSSSSNDIQDWYLSLKECASKLFRGDKEVDKTLKSLTKYCQDDLKNTAHLKEYVCLLSQSFSVLEICTEPVQQAFRFVIRDVLGSYDELFDQWMRHRRLPIMGL